MNILFVCSAKSWGGNEKWTSMAMHHLSAKHNVYFFGRNRGLAEKFGAATAREFAPMFSNFDLFSFFKAWNFLRKHKINCVVSTKKKEYFIFGILTRLLKIKHLIRLGIVREMKMPLWHNLIYNKLNDGIIVNAKRIETTLRRYDFMQNKKVYLLYNAIPGLDNIPQNQAETNRHFTIVSTGMLTKRKGFHLLVDAIANLDETTRQKIRVTFVGTGRERENLQRQIQQNHLENTIELAGFQSNPIAYLNKANLFVLLSSNEGISNALIEAMAAAVPVLTTDSGGSTEFIEQDKNGFITDRDISSIGQKLSAITDLDPEILKQKGIKGKETVLTIFNEHRFEKEIQQIFEEI
jgi:glycosyltransferase involved in cell wall biosynthesis